MAPRKARRSETPDTDDEEWQLEEEEHDDEYEPASPRLRGGGAKAAAAKPTRRSSRPAKRRLVEEQEDFELMMRMVDEEEEEVAAAAAAEPRKPAKRSKAKASEPEELAHLNAQRVGTMSEAQLRTRIKRITKLDKLQSFIDTLEEEGMDELADEARERLEALQSR